MQNQASGKEGGSDGATADDSGEDQEASSSSQDQVEDTLASFREQWQRELDISPNREAPKITTVNIDDEKEDLSVENQAKKMFLKGIEHEQNGELYDAIRFYKRAVQLVPDIEFKLYESTKLKTKDIYEDSDTLQTLENCVDDIFDDDDDDDDDDEQDCDLFTKLSKVVGRNCCLCFPHFEQSAVHISALPMEIILYILRWVVSPELDLRSLEMFSRVCRGFYISAYDEEIWRLACIRIWGVNCGHYEPKYRSWRRMYIERPRLRHDGCYISKNTYIRSGDKNFQDQFYRPWHLVEYFRYLRFFADGKVLMLTSSDDAQSCVAALKHRSPRNLSALIGHYRLHDSNVSLVLKRQENKANSHMFQRKKRREVVHDSGEQTFHLEFEIQSQQKRLNFQLNWISYNILTEYKNGQPTQTCLNVYRRYPSFKFSRVKSYTQESHAPLQ